MEYVNCSGPTTAQSTYKFDRIKRFGVVQGEYAAYEVFEDPLQKNHDVQLECISNGSSPNTSVKVGSNF